MKIGYVQSARNDLDLIYEYLAQFDHMAADRMIDRIRVTIAELDQYSRRKPRWGTKVPETYRCSVAGYAAFYQLKDDPVIIGRVVHLRRDFGALDLNDSFDGS